MPQPSRGVWGDAADSFLRADLPVKRQSLEVESARITPSSGASYRATQASLASSQASPSSPEVESARITQLSGASSRATQISLGASQASRATQVSRASSAATFCSFRNVDRQVSRQEFSTIIRVLSCRDFGNDARSMCVESYRRRRVSTVEALGFSEQVYHDAPRRYWIWVVTFTITLCLVLAPLPLSKHDGEWCIRGGSYLKADTPGWIFAPWFAAALVAAFIDDRGRYCSHLELHYWIWRYAKLAFMGSFTSTFFQIYYSLHKCNRQGFVENVMKLCFSIASLSWMVSAVILNWCVILKLRMLGQTKASDLCTLLFRLQLLMSAFQQGFWACKYVLFIDDKEMRHFCEMLLSGCMLCSISIFIPFFVKALVAMDESAQAAEAEAAEGAVPLIMRKQVERAGAWTRHTAMATGACGASLILIYATMSIFQGTQSVGYESDSSYFTVPLLAFNCCYVLDTMLNSVCAAFLSGLVGPRLNATNVEVILQEVGTQMIARKIRDAEETDLAHEALDSLGLIPVSDDVRSQLHELELALSEVFCSSQVPGEGVSEEDTREMFTHYRSRCEEEMARMMELMQDCCAAYQVLKERWQFITQIQSIAVEAECTQELPLAVPAPAVVEGVVLEYFSELHKRMAEATEAFHESFGIMVEDFKQASMASDLGLSEETFPFIIHRRGSPTVQPGPLKSRDRARAKYEEKPNGKIAWPPLAAGLLDLIRTTVLFGDPYDLAVFLYFMGTRFHIVRVKNRFKDFNPHQPGGFRNVHTNIVFEHNGHKLIVEVQLHLLALFVAGKMIHSAYEVARAETVAEVIGPPYKWTVDYACEMQELIEHSMAESMTEGPGNRERSRTLPNLRKSLASRLRRSIGDVLKLRSDASSAPDVLVTP